MKMFGVCCSVLLLQSMAFNGGQDDEHHHHHHHHHAKDNDATTAQESKVVASMKALSEHLAEKAKIDGLATQSGHLLVNGPVPADFSTRFAEAVAQASGADARSVQVTATNALEESPDVVSIDFNAPGKVVSLVESEAADAESKLATGYLHSFLVAKAEPEEKKPAPKVQKSKDIDIDTAMPYGDLEPFGREDTAQELTEDAVTESNQMVDQLEKAEVAEEKRSVFRALTRLRGAAITSFDGVARSQTGNIDEYNKVHKWRKTHPVHHLANEESDVTKWAFPDNADLLQKDAHPRNQ